MSPPPAPPDAPRDSPPAPPPNPVRDFVAGGVAGAANLTAGYAFDTVKVVKQAAPPGAHASSWAVARSIVRESGVGGLYRGMSAPLAGAALETAVNYWAFVAALRWFAPRWHPASGDRPPLAAVPVAAAFAGVCLSPCLSGFELIKVRLQADGRRYNHSPLAVVRATLAAEGARGLARGLGGTLAREVPGNAVFFTVYESIRRLLAADGPPPSAAASAALAVGAGAVSGAAMWAAVLPADVVKTRVQVAPPGTLPRPTLGSEFRSVLKAGGVRSLWTGLGPTLARAAPANAAQWLAWDAAIQLWPER